MDDMEDDARYPPKSFTLNRQTPSHRQKHPIRGPPIHHHRPTTAAAAARYEEQQYDDDDDDDEDPDEFDGYGADENNDDDDGEGQNGYPGNNNFDEGLFPKKKRKIRGSPIPSYEFAPRGKFSYGNPEEWSEHATFVLLEVWGDKFLQHGRESLRSEDWRDVADKVSEELKAKRTEAQCRSMLDKLKRRYKKEKSRVEEMGLGSCKWAFFKKMDMLMASSSRQEYGLACGVDSGEYVFMNTRVYLNRSNGFDEMRDSPGESESSDDDDLEGVGVGGRRRRGGHGGVGDDDDEEEGSFRVLADSIQKFGKIYEKIETSKRQQMMELEKMRLDFNRELELQKKQILERAQAEISKIQEVDDDDDDEDEDEMDTSVENLSE